MVRNCPLVEILHSELGARHGAAGTEFVERLTTELCPLVAAAWVKPPPDAEPAAAGSPAVSPSAFLGLQHRYQDAWTLLGEIAAGRRSGASQRPLPRSNRPPTPFSVRLDDAFDPDSGRFKANGADPRVHHDELARIGWLAQHPGVPFATPDWTRLGRSCEKLLSLVDGLLTRGITISTINAHAEPGLLRLRQPPVPIPCDFAERVDVLGASPWLRDLDPGALAGVPDLAGFCGLQQRTRLGDGGRRNVACICGSGVKRKHCCVVATQAPLTIV